MKCPHCGKENTNPSLKNWFFNGFNVSRFVCSECGLKFNFYEGERKNFTIPKTQMNSEPINIKR